jgi:hypothetical protein
MQQLFILFFRSLHANQIAMKSAAFLCLVFFVLCAFLVHDVEAAMAIAIAKKGTHRIVYVAWGYTVGLAKQNVVKLANRNKADSFRVAAWTDVRGYTAVASSTRGNAVGWSMGQPSEMMAQKRAIENCLKVGGVNPKIISSAGDYHTF